MATRKPASRGHIEQRPNGTFRATVFAGRDPLTGRKRYLKQTLPTLKLAERALTKMQNEVDERRHSRSSMTVSGAIAEWLDASQHEASTRARYDQLIRLYIDPTIGKLDLGKIDVLTLERFYARLQKCRELCSGRSGSAHTCLPLAPNTVRKIHFILRAAFGAAVRYELIGVNVAEMCRPPAFARRDPDQPSAAEVAALLAEASRDEEWALLLWLTMTVGWRRGELCALRWHNVDLDEGRITIDRAFWERQEKSTKTHQRRVIAIDESAIAKLREHRERCAADCAKLGLQLPPSGFVFSPAPDRSTPMLPRSVTQRYRRLAQTVGLRSTRLHALRHYSATELISSGVDLRTVAGRLGHGSGGATTLKVYAAFSSEADRKAAGTIAGRVPAPDPTQRQIRTAYEKLAVQLRQQIESGQLRRGDELPALAELAKTHGMAANTAARALSLLKDEGLIEVVRGQRAVVLPLRARKKTDSTRSH